MNNLLAVFGIEQGHGGIFAANLFNPERPATIRSADYSVLRRGKLLSLLPCSRTYEIFFLIF